MKEMITQVADELDDVVESATKWLRRIGERAASQKPAPGKWSKKEILGHLIDSASNNHHRFIRAQETDTLFFPAYDQDSWVEKQHYNEAVWAELIDLWRHYNRHLSQVVRHMPADRLRTQCTITPNDPVTLEYLVRDYLEHLKHHLKQLRD